MEIVINELNTRPLLMEHITSGVKKILKNGENAGTVNLSLDKTRPEYIAVQTRESDEGRLYSLTYFLEGRIIYTSDWILDGDEKALELQAGELIDQGEKKQKAEYEEYAIALERLDDAIRRMKATREVFACRNDAMLLAHKRELQEHFARVQSYIVDLDSFLWAREKRAAGEDPMADEIFLKEDEVRTILSVFEELRRMPYSKLNTFLGSITIEEMQKLNGKLSKWYQSEDRCYEEDDDDEE